LPGYAPSRLRADFTEVLAEESFGHSDRGLGTGDRVLGVERLQWAEYPVAERSQPVKVRKIALRNSGVVGVFYFRRQRSNSGSRAHRSAQGNHKSEQHFAGDQCVWPKSLCIESNHVTGIHQALNVLEVRVIGRHIGERGLATFSQSDGVSVSFLLLAHQPANQFSAGNGSARIELAAGCLEHF